MSGDSRISQLLSPPNTLSGSEVIPLNQNGVTYQSTLSSILAIGGLSGGSFTNVTYSGLLSTTTPISYSDTNILAQVASSVNSYNQIILQNKSNGATASTNLNVSNDQGTATTNFGEFGMNSSGFTGTGSFNKAGYVYLASASTDLAIGTYGANSIHFVVNSGATDAMTINGSTGAVNVPGAFSAGSFSIGSINNTPIGNTTPSTGAFTTLSATTPIGVASGGTGASTGPAARTSLGAAASGANADITSLSALTSINSGPLYGNRIKNSNKQIAQRATSATVTAGTAVPTASTGYPTVDRFYGYCTGASVTVAQVAGSDNTNKRVQYTGAASVAAIGHGTRLKASETAHMASQTATYSVELANSLLTTVTWAAYYATTQDAFGTVGTPTKTQIATGSFTVNSTVTKYSTQIAIPAAATTGIEIVLTVGAQTSGTWTIGREDFRLGSVSPTYFEVSDSSQDLLSCEHYYRTIVWLNSVVASAGSQNTYTAVTYEPMRAVPTAVKTGGTFTNCTDPGSPTVATSSFAAYASSIAAGPTFANYTVQLNAEIP